MVTMYHISGVRSASMVTRASRKERYDAGRERVETPCRPVAENGRARRQREEVVGRLQADPREGKLVQSGLVKSSRAGAFCGICASAQYADENRTRDVAHWLGY